MPRQTPEFDEETRRRSRVETPDAEIAESIPGKMKLEDPDSLVQTNLHRVKAVTTKMHKRQAEPLSHRH